MLIWGVVIATIGGIMILWGRSQSEFIVYRLLAARSRTLWGDRVHSFYQVVGAILVAVGTLVSLRG